MKTVGPLENVERDKNHETRPLVGTSVADLDYKPHGISKLSERCRGCSTIPGVRGKITGAKLRL